MSCSADLDIRAAHKVIADLNLANIKDYEVIVCEKVRSDFDVITIVAVERRFDSKIAFLCLSQDLAEELFSFRLLFGMHIIVLVKLLLTFHALFIKSVHP